MCFGCPVTVIMLIMQSIMAAQFAHFLAHHTKASIKNLRRQSTRLVKVLGTKLALPAFATL